MKWREKLLHWGFEIGIWFKGLDGILELIGGVLLLAFNPDTLNHIIVNLTEHELQQDPGDWICNTLRHAGDHLYSNTRIWGSVYLLSHGAIKVFLAGGIIFGKLWAYPTAMIVIGGFILFQSGRLMVHFSYPLLAATVIDIIIVLLVWREYHQVKHKKHTRKAR
ncbi:MAG TPA: DUF2127 domain-containing protein [Desulfuromonadaceae bacterium]|nr:DUF2127 domain-containing protein [Desulfuromonadaceae bacterium]